MLCPCTACAVIIVCDLARMASDQYAGQCRPDSTADCAIVRLSFRLCNAHRCHPGQIATAGSISRSPVSEGRVPHRLFQAVQTSGALRVPYERRLGLFSLQNAIRSTQTHFACPPRDFPANPAPQLRKLKVCQNLSQVSAFGRVMMTSPEHITPRHQINTRRRWGEMAAQRAGATATPPRESGHP